MCTCQINLYSIDIMLILLKIQSKRYNNNGIQSTCQMSCYLLKFELDFVNNKWQKKKCIQSSGIRTVSNRRAKCVGIYSILHWIL